MPDFDIDFCYEGRQRVIDYVVKKYGLPNSKVTLHRSAIRAVLSTAWGTFAKSRRISDISEEIRILPLLYRLSAETGIPLAATNDAHYSP